MLTFHEKIKLKTIKFPEAKFLINYLKSSGYPEKKGVPIFNECMTEMASFYFNKFVADYVKVFTHDNWDTFLEKDIIKKEGNEVVNEMINYKKDGFKKKALITMNDNLILEILIKDHDITPETKNVFEELHIFSAL